MTSKELLNVLRYYVTQKQEGLSLSCEELAKNTPFTKEEIHRFLASKATAQVLKKRYGLRPPPLIYTEQSLTSRQLRVLTHVTNPFTQKPLTQLLKEQSIDLNEWREWLSRPHFRNAYNARTVREGSQAKAEVFRRTLNKATQGDQKAVETYFRMINEPLPELTKVSSTEGTIEIHELLKVLQQVLPVEQLGAVAYALQTRNAPPEILELESGEGSFSESEPGQLNGLDLINPAPSSDFGSEANDPELDPT